MLSNAKTVFLHEVATIAQWAEWLILAALLIGLRHGLQHEADRTVADIRAVLDGQAALVDARIPAQSAFDFRPPIHLVDNKKPATGQANAGTPPGQIRGPGGLSPRELVIARRAYRQGRAQLLHTQLLWLNGGAVAVLVAVVVRRRMRTAR